MDTKYDNVILSAKYVLPVSSPVIRNGGVYVKNGIIRDVGSSGKLSKQYKADVLDLGKGILMPGFINAHTHLELGSLQARLDPAGDFPSWILEIIKRRFFITKNRAQEAVRQGIATLLQSGVAGVGEISTMGADRQDLADSPLYTVLFREVRFLNSLIKRPYDGSPVLEERPFPHAPYSTSPETYIETAKRFPVYGTHVAESIDETMLITGQDNNFSRKLGLIIKRKPLMHGSRSPVDYLNRLGFLDRKATLVHCVHADKQDIDLAASRDAGIVLCPRSNAYLGVGLPDIGLFRDYPRLGIGTDGLSSNYSLDMMDEIRFLYLIARPALKSAAETFVITAATLGGARSLFIEDKLGSIEAGKRAGLIYLDTDVAKNIYLTIINTPSSQIKNLTGNLTGEIHG